MMATLILSETKHYWLEAQHEVCGGLHFNQLLFLITALLAEVCFLRPR
jgi:hypothetical protein